MARGGRVAFPSLFVCALHKLPVSVSAECQLRLLNENPAGTVLDNKSPAMFIEGSCIKSGLLNRSRRYRGIYRKDKKWQTTAGTIACLTSGEMDARP
jgi:hypothetical protein